MQGLVKFIHFLGLVLFLGSIFTYVAISMSIEHATLEGAVFGRDVIESGTQWLTLPGLWMLVLSGLYAGYARFGAKSWFLRIKFLLGILIVVNAHFLVVPAVHAATGIAKASLDAGHWLPEYASAYWRESIFGGINVLLSLIAAAVAIWRRKGYAVAARAGESIAEPT